MQRSSTCTSCMNGFFLNNMTCQACQYPCVTCKLNATTCFSCPYRYYLALGQCRYCPDNCLSCSFSVNLAGVECIRCANGFYKTTTSYGLQTCQPCSNKGCSLCSPSASNSNLTTCIYCPMFSSLVNGNCIKCPQDCVTCETNDEGVACSACGIGFGLVNNSCIDCPMGCSSCKNASSCEVCNDQFVLNATTGLCMDCTSFFGKNCHECSSNMCT